MMAQCKMCSKISTGTLRMGPSEGILNSDVRTGELNRPLMAEDSGDWREAGTWLRSNLVVSQLNGSRIEDASGLYRRTRRTGTSLHATTQVNTRLAQSMTFNRDSHLSRSRFLPFQPRSIGDVRGTHSRLSLTDPHVYDETDFWCCYVGSPYCGSRERLRLDIDISICIRHIFTLNIFQ